MSDVFFVLKSLVVTVVLVFLMQIRIGPATIEQHSLAWLQNSVFVDNLRNVAAGAIKAATNGYQSLTGGAHEEPVVSNDAAAKPAPGSRLERFRLKRSDAYYREQERKHLDRAARDEDEPASNDNSTESDID